MTPDTTRGAPILSLALSLLAAGCGTAADAREERPGQAEVCEVSHRNVSLPAEVRETSGLAPSSARQDVFWTHNDSGGDPVVFAVDTAGRMVGGATVTGARNLDWEDIATAPCGPGRCLYIADTGDNEENRPSVSVYRVAEPAPGATSTAPAERIDFRFPDAPQDVEAIFVVSGEIFLVTKGNQRPVAVYRSGPAPAPGSIITLRRGATLGSGSEERVNRVTGASLSPDGNTVAVRTYTSLHLFRTADVLRGGTPPSERFDLGTLEEAQGEGVALVGGGEVLLTSEGQGKQEPAVLSRLSCRVR